MDETSTYPTLLKLNDVGETIAPVADDIRTRRVVDRDGVDVGRIQDLLIDSVHHTVRMLRVEHGGILGFGATASFVPVEAVTMITDDVVHIDQTRERVAKAPLYEPDVVAAPVTYSALYGYYSYAPFWERW